MSELSKNQLLVLTLLCIFFIICIVGYWQANEEPPPEVVNTMLFESETDAKGNEAVLEEVQIDLTDHSKIPPQYAVAMNPNLQWISENWIRLYTRDSFLENINNHPKFTVFRPNYGHIWGGQFQIPIDPRRYPIAVMRYRALNTKDSHDQVIFMDDDRGPGGGGTTLFYCRDLIPDGEIHEVHKDMRELDIRGFIRKFCLFVYCAEEGPAEFELLGLRFQPALEETASSEVDSWAGEMFMPEEGTEAGNPEIQEIFISTNTFNKKEPLPDDRAVKIQVVDPDKKPVEGAEVVVDFERLNWSRRGITDKDGRVSLVPLANVTNRHSLQVKAPGMDVFERGNYRAGQKEHMVKLRLPGSFVGSVVEKDSDKPVAGVEIKVQSWPTQSVLTDEEGGFHFEGLRCGTRTDVEVKGEGYAFKHFSINPRPGRPINGKVIVTRDSPVNGQVIDQNGNPLPDAKINLGEDYHRTLLEIPVDENGDFEFKGVPPNVISKIYATMVGYAVVGVELDPNDRESLKDIVITLPPECVMNGVVVDNSGRPVRNARVEISEEPRLRSTTDLGGGFKLLRLEDRDYKLNVIIGNTPPKTFGPFNSKSQDVQIVFQ